MSFVVVDTPHGRAAIVDASSVPDDVHAGERAVADALSPTRRREWIAGRAAVRALLPDAGAILRDDRGAPILPAGWVGSISHKHARAAALVAPATGARVGVDLELAAPARIDVARRVLTDAERAALPAGDGRAVTLRFAIKEAVYKAIDPFVRRYVGFHEVELDLSSDGNCVVRSALPLAIAAWWCERDGHWLATATALPSASGA